MPNASRRRRKRRSRLSGRYALGETRKTRGRPRLSGDRYPSGELRPVGPTAQMKIKRRVWLNDRLGELDNTLDIMKAAGMITDEQAAAGAEYQRLYGLIYGRLSARTVLWAEGGARGRSVSAEMSLSDAAGVERKFRALDHQLAGEGSAVRQVTRRIVLDNDRPQWLCDQIIYQARFTDLERRFRAARQALDKAKKAYGRRADMVRADRLKTCERACSELGKMLKALKREAPDEDIGREDRDDLGLGLSAMAAWL